MIKKQELHLDDSDENKKFAKRCEKAFDDRKPVMYQGKKCLVYFYKAVENGFVIGIVALEH